MPLTSYADSITHSQIISNANNSWSYFYSNSNGSCADAGIPSWMVITRLVDCIENTMIAGVYNTVLALANLLVTTVGAMLALAVVFFGTRMALGEQGVQKKSMGFILRLVLVTCFFLGVDSLINAPYVIMQELTQVVTSGAAANGLPTTGWSPWVQMDYILATFFGYGEIAPGQPRQIFQGIAGMISASLFSSTSGIFMFVFGMVSTITMVSLVLRAIYTYLAALALLSFVLIISPFMIPLAIFQWTERYTNKWLQYMAAAMLVPMMLFAGLYIMIGLLDIIMQQIFAALNCNINAVGDCFKSYWKFNQPMFSWMMPTDPAIWANYENKGLTYDAPPMHSFLNPMMGATMDMNVASTPALDFGPSNVYIMQAVMLQFIALAIALVITRSIVDAIPSIADDIAGVATSLRLEELPFSNEFNRALKMIKASIAGGAK